MRLKVNTQIKTGKALMLYSVPTTTHRSPKNRDEGSEKPTHLAPFVIYILYEQLNQGMGDALIYTGSQISLVTESSLFRGAKLRKQKIQINGITGSTMEKKGQINLTISGTSAHEFTVINDLPMDCDMLIGHDWLERFGYQFKIPSLGINLPAYSETVVRIPTREKGFATS
jgi:hypothetical protein